jgi:hypothetical protein
VNGEVHGGRPRPTGAVVPRKKKNNHESGFVKYGSSPHWEKLRQVKGTQKYLLLILLFLNRYTKRDQLVTAHNSIYFHDVNILNLFSDIFLRGTTRLVKGLKSFLSSFKQS